MPRTILSLARGRMLTRSGMVLALQAAGLGLTYGVEVALARLLGPADYGIYRYVVAAIALLATLAGLGLPVLALRLIPVYLHQQRSDLLHGFLRSSTCLVALAALPFGALGVLGFRLFELPAHDLTLLAPSLLVGTLGMAWMNLATETSLALSRPVLAYLPARTLRPLVVLAIALGLAGAHPTIAVVLVASIASFFVAAGVQSALLRRNIRSGGTRSETRLGDWLPVALQLLMPVVLGVSVANLDLLIVGRFVPLEEIGAYGAAQRTASLIGLFLLSANSVAAPLYAALWERQEREALQSLLTTFAHWSTWPALAVALALVPLCDFVMLMFGPDYTIGAGPLVILGFGQASFCAAGPAQSLLQMTGQQLAVVRAWLMALGADLLLNLILVPSFGTWGAATASAASLLLCSVSLRRSAFRRLGLRTSVLSR